jgi:mannose-6-phosphate isomerase
MIASARLFGGIRPYAWGSRRFLAELEGRPAPSREPEAELWLGAHAGLSARLGARDGQLLREAIAAEPERALGTRVRERFDSELPFLLKVLAAAEPLSLQAHPNPAQARAGYAREQAEQVPLGAEHRSYKDPHHKPELLVALTPFRALYGFRRVDATRRLFATLDVPALDPYLEPLAEADPRRALRQTFERLMRASPEEQRALAEATLGRAQRLLSVMSKPDDTLPLPGPFQREFQWATRIGALYPGDVGVVGALLLNLVELRPFEGLYLPAGNLHAYLEGAGVELMASSDNVLRGGLTTKHVNVPELLDVLDFSELDPTPLSATRQGEQWLYSTPAPEFRLARLQPQGTCEVSERSGPEILLVTEGALKLELDAESIALASGGAAFIPAAEGAYRLTGTGTVFRAFVP